MYIWRYREGEKGKRRIKRKKHKQTERERNRKKCIIKRYKTGREREIDRPTDKQTGFRALDIYLRHFFRTLLAVFL